MALPADPVFPVDPGKSGEFVTAAQQELLMESPDAREARRSAGRAELPYPQPPLRGKKREFGFDLRDDEPEVLSDYDVRRLGIFLDRKGAPVLDEINKHYSPDPKPQVIEWYLTRAGVKRERRAAQHEAANPRLFDVPAPEVSPEERKQKRLAKQRQTQHIADGLQRILRNNIGASQVRLAAIQSVRSAHYAGRVPDGQALLFAADAIEDLGACLAEDPKKLKGIPRREELGLEIGYFGYYMGEHPDFFGRQPLMLLLAQREQQRRLPFWQSRLDAMLQIDSDRRTEEYKASEVATQALIARFLTAGETSNGA